MHSLLLICMYISNFIVIYSVLLVLCSMQIKCDGQSVTDGWTDVTDRQSDNYMLSQISLGSIKRKTLWQKEKLLGKNKVEIIKYDIQPKVYRWVLKQFDIILLRFFFLYIKNLQIRNEYLHIIMNCYFSKQDLLCENKSKLMYMIRKIFT